MAHTDQYLDTPDGYRFSASQISTFLSCKRKWAWTYVLGLRGFGTASTSLGTEIHEQLENYLNGLEVDYVKPSGYIAASGFEHLPQPNTPGMEVEKDFVLEGRHKWYGLKDVRLPGGVVIDHKSTKDFRYCKTPEDLLEDPQAVIYAMDEFKRDPSLMVVNLNWVYYRTTGAKASRRVHLPMAREHAEEAFSCLEGAADEAMALVLAARGLDGDELRAQIRSVEHNADHCGDYGGCQFQGLCNLSPTEKFKSIMSNANMSLAARLRAQAAKEDSASGTSAPAMPAAPSAPPAEIKINPPEYQPPPTAEDIAKKEKPKKEPKAKKDSPPAETSAPEPRTFVLYEDCLPVNVTVTYADELFMLAKEMILEEHKASDYRFIDYKGSGILLQTVTQILDTKENLRNLVVTKNSPEANICLPLFRVRAAQVIVGTR